MLALAVLSGRCVPPGQLGPVCVCVCEVGVRAAIAARGSPVTREPTDLSREPPGNSGPAGAGPQARAPPATLPSRLGKPRPRPSDAGAVPRPSPW